jgi:hypothetical protein
VIERLAKCQATGIRAQNNHVRMLMFQLGDSLKYAVNKSKSALQMKSEAGLSQLARFRASPLTGLMG